MRIRVASIGEIDVICRFGATHIPPQYEPLLGAKHALARVENWWTLDRISRAVEEIMPRHLCHVRWLRSALVCKGVACGSIDEVQTPNLPASPLARALECFAAD